MARALLDAQPWIRAMRERGNNFRLTSTSAPASVYQSFSGGPSTTSRTLSDTAYEWIDEGNYSFELRASDGSVETVDIVVGASGGGGGGGGSGDISGALGVVKHGNDANAARPTTGYAAYVWIGAAQPLNASVDDFWIPKTA